MTARSFSSQDKHNRERPIFGSAASGRARDDHVAEIVMWGIGASHIYIYLYLRVLRANYQRWYTTTQSQEPAQDSCHHVASQCWRRSLCIQKRYRQPHLDWQEKRKSWIWYISLNGARSRRRYLAYSPQVLSPILADTWNMAKASRSALSEKSQKRLDLRSKIFDS
jgi:hypothetical protein